MLPLSQLDLWDVFFDMSSCRDTSSLRQNFMKACCVQSGAVAAVLYEPDVLGRKLVPTSTSNNIDRSELPLISIDQTGSLYREINHLNNKSNTLKIELNSSGESLVTHCFGKTGVALCHRVYCEEPVQHYYVFLHFDMQNPVNIENLDLHLNSICKTFHQLRFLVDSLEVKKDELKEVQIRLSHNRDYLERARNSQLISEDLIGISDSIRTVRSKILQYAASDFSILLQGQTGSGKSLVTRLIHKYSKYKETSNKLHDFEDIEKLNDLHAPLPKGTLVVNEISDLDAQQQHSLMRLIQRNNQNSTPQFRLIVSTSKPANSLIKKFGVREDLFHRVSQLFIQLPTIQQRLEDVTELIDHFLFVEAERNGQQRKHMNEDAMALLNSHTFPGNVRELQNCIIEANLMADDQVNITKTVIQKVLDRLEASSNPEPVSSKNSEDLPLPSSCSGLKSKMLHFEKSLLENSISEFSGNRTLMAMDLNIPQRTLAHKLKIHGLLATEGVK